MDSSLHLENHLSAIQLWNKNGFCFPCQSFDLFIRERPQSNRSEISNFEPSASCLSYSSQTRASNTAIRNDNNISIFYVFHCILHHIISETTYFTDQPKHLLFDFFRVVGRKSPIVMSQSRNMPCITVSKRSHARQIILRIWTIWDKFFRDINRPLTIHYWIRPCFRKNYFFSHVSQHFIAQDKHWLSKTLSHIKRSDSYIKTFLN